MNDRPEKRPGPRYARKTAEARRRELIAAAIHCLGEGGMTAFTIDRICQEAKVSRGLINHHFHGKDDLLVCAYEAMTAYLTEPPFASAAVPPSGPAQHLRAVIAASFDPETFDWAQLRAWLALWGEVPGNPRLLALHTARYDAFQETLAAAITETARERKLEVDAGGLARRLVALIDGLWLHCCIEPNDESLATARNACTALLDSELGPL